MRKILIIADILAFLMVAALFYLLIIKPNPIGSVTVGNEYNGTTTFPTNGTFATLKVGTGALGQVTITGAAAGIFTLYDATTTDVTKRTGAIATSSLVKIGTFPTSAAAGTYVFDRVFNLGLLFVLDQGTQGTSTITWR
jgi:hypothetical protein